VGCLAIMSFLWLLLPVILFGGEGDLEELQEEDDDKDCSILDDLYSFLMTMAGSDMMESDGTGGGANCGTGGGGGGG